MCDHCLYWKNLFKRGRLRSDLSSVFTAFNDYVIGEDLRPSQVANELYGDPRLDWVVLTCNNIINIRDEWPLGSVEFRKFWKNYKVISNVLERSLCVI